MIYHGGVLSVPRSTLKYSSSLSPLPGRQPSMNSLFSPALLLPLPMRQFSLVMIGSFAQPPSLKIKEVQRGSGALPNALNQKEQGRASGLFVFQHTCDSQFTLSTEDRASRHTQRNGKPSPSSLPLPPEFSASTEALRRQSPQVHTHDSLPLASQRASIRSSDFILMGAWMTMGISHRCVV